MPLDQGIAPSESSLPSTVDFNIWDPEPTAAELAAFVEAAN